MTTIQDDVVERITSYIKHNATKEPPSLRALVKQGHAQLAALLDGMSDGQAAFKPAPGVWSVMEVLRHVVGSERGVARRCVTLARGEASASFEPEDEAPAFASLGDARATLVASHEELLAAIDTLTPESDLAARFEHPLFGDLNCREWAAFQRVHDGDHANQIEQVRSAPGYPAS